MPNPTQDPHTGGSLTEMAESGTSIPNDAGLNNLLPSLPRPSQTTESKQFDNQGVGEPTLDFAADNPKDLPRSTKDMGVTGEVITGTGDALPAEIEAKGLEIGARHPGAKGRTRDIKHRNLNRSIFGRMAREDEFASQAIGEHEGRNKR